MGAEPDVAALRARVIKALPAWLVPLVQFNGMIASRLGVTANELQCLYVLDHQGPSTAGELARRVNLTSGSASRMIDRLVAHGYVTRAPDPGDRRRVLVAANREAIDRVSEYYDRLNDRLAADLAGFEVSELDALLRFVAAAQRSTETELRRI
jgi:DNA-binding MarR family transcriptional regulator